MVVEAQVDGFVVAGSLGRVRVGPCRPGATVRVAGRDRAWHPHALEPGTAPGSWVAAGGPGGVRLELSVREVRSDGTADATTSPDEVEVRVRLVNAGPVAVEVDRIVVLGANRLTVGEDPRTWRSYRNGYQSWAGTRTIGVDERDRDLPTSLARAAATDARHPAPTAVGHVRSDAVGAVVEPVSGDALAIGFTTLADAYAFVEIEAPHGELRSISAWADLDGVDLEPGAATPELVVRLALVEGRPDAGWLALRRVVEAAGAAMGARGLDRRPPGGWCSWYYYFTKVTEPDVVADLAVLAADGRDGPSFGCEYVMVDDGHQSAIGDWLITDEASFPSGMAAMADRITDAGFDAGIWWAPFLASPRSRVAREHPEWLLRGERGHPVIGLFNPGWSKVLPMWVLDTTHPEVLAHLTHVAATIAAWGYGIQKLDFLYAASLQARRHDPTATRAEALRRGLDAVRAGAGDDAFLLGCGCPLGPAVGVVDAMRIGADVTPYWSNVIDRVGGRGLHGLATRNAVANTLTRSVLAGAWWLNDPDCLLARDTETRLTEEEVRLMATAFCITDGMLVLSDRMATVSDARRSLVAQARGLAGGRHRVIDLFARDLPELVVSRHPDRVDIALLNLSDRRRAGRVDLARLVRDHPDLVPASILDPEHLGAGSGERTELWTGRPVAIGPDGLADLGPVPVHGARVLQLPI